ncbi:bifunctional adenosylcobinamide kinase/adenosylcobinamide-phosphate guanylyltransferase [Halorhodospira abdelmalekii]|uniref:bifunctional adenosylcobinamide kinase/adenosylcobinamide-phosphate guanylyltransferase n=1 Tax=Halorhodospira abdelmalekii TaxID=421629 RepID=UPI0019036FF1|nr:bifunctional adenosylcobinamide kinase/adenosylcobinamide-phosphate guanylyltransferase [Halorhodospira abdelmalekii]MBK1735465.1 bifunctional adenosylcobinamide kinase/adenosylcobinamide-phosphate guanylyltransferase [Halorhodospira abdelmalekii]
MREFILGGARSGKSRLAERLALASGLPVTYVATAQATDDAEMQTRIEHHRRRRPKEWGLVEVGADLAKVLTHHARPDHCLLVDCLTLWLSQLLWEEEGDREGGEKVSSAEEEGRREPALSPARVRQEAFLEVLPTLPGYLIVVSNETGMGIVPLGALTRRFCDEAGRLHQAVAAHSDRVVLTVAGLPTVLKGPPLPLAER